MISCKKINIDEQLYQQLRGLANPCQYKNDNLLTIKRPLSPRSTNEKNLLKTLSKQMWMGTCPKLFPFLYLNYVCGNDLFLVFKKDDGVLTKSSDTAWWVNVLFQIAKSVAHLESMSINHNNLHPENIRFQNFSTNPNHVAISIVNFENIGGDFYFGKDLNFFLYTLIFGPIGVPEELGNKLKPLILYKREATVYGESEFQYGMRRTRIEINNNKLSGDNLAKLLHVWFPGVV